jgi:hypothetical protein
VTDPAPVDKPAETGTRMPEASHMVVRVWLPDRPGALGLVASRIGALGADIVGVDVLERSSHIAVDEFAISLPNVDLVRLLVREIEEVDGASVEEWRLVGQFPDPRLDALETVERLCGASEPEDVCRSLVDAIRTEFEADWAAVVEGDRVVAAAGSTVPEPAVLTAVAAGTAASPAIASGQAGPGELAAARFPVTDAVLVVGRDGHPFRLRERRQLIALARIADLLTRR